MTAASPAAPRVPVRRGALWTARQRQASSLHEVSYRACFKPQLPGHFIRRYTRPGAVVLDPFLGRGTTAVEAALLGRVPAGNDVNPLSAVLARPRIEPPEPGEIAARVAALPLDRRAEAGLDLSMFYHPRTLRELAALRAYLADRRRAGAEDAVDRWIRMVATNRLTGHSAGFFSVYTLPPNQAASPARQRKINARLGQKPEYRDVRALIHRKSLALLADVPAARRAALRRAAPRARFLTGPAERLALPDGSVDLVVTSPPFLDVVDYAADNWLRNWFNGIDGEAVAAGVTALSSLGQWAAAMERALAEIARVLKPGARAAFEVGEVRRGAVRLDEAVVPAGRAAGLRPESVLINVQKFTKTAHIWGVSNNAGGTNTNRIVLFRKPGGHR